uniref:Uncharacterized protein n=1 Tax=Cannabis sativa TaxID=3483 RepID=A0A803Q3M9_CANSA
MWASLLLLCLSSHDTKLSDDHDLGNYSILDSWDEMRVVELFQNWKEKHKRVYRLPEEAEMRFENFKRNVKYILESSKSRKGHQLGLNRFADLSNEEFRKLYLSNVTKPLGGKRRRNNPMRTRLDSCDAPSSLDWRKRGVVTAVKDQGDCGSCWAFSSTGAMEGVNAIVTGDLISLSEQELVDCDSTNYGCDGGYMDYAFEWVINNAGIDSESDYSYTGQDGTCNKAKEERKVVTIDGYEDVGESDRDLLCATIHQPISVGIDGSALDFQLYTGGIYDGDCSDNPNDIDHAVLIVGYGSEGDEDYWIVKNSWGTSWGIQGYFYIKRNTNLPYGFVALELSIVALMITQFVILKKGFVSRFRIYPYFKLWEAHNHAFHDKVVPNAIGVLCKIKKCLACLSAFGEGPLSRTTSGNRVSYCGGAVQLSSSDPLEAETLALSQVVSLCVSQGWYDCFDFEPTRHPIGGLLNLFGSC